MGKNKYRLIGSPSPSIIHLDHNRSKLWRDEEINILLGLELATNSTLEDKVRDLETNCGRGRTKRAIDNELKLLRYPDNLWPWKNTPYKQMLKPYDWSYLETKYLRGLIHRAMVAKVKLDLPRMANQMCEGLAQIRKRHPKHLDHSHLYTPDAIEVAILFLEWRLPKRPNSSHLSRSEAQEQKFLSLVQNSIHLPLCDLAQSLAAVDEVGQVPESEKIVFDRYYVEQIIDTQLAGGPDLESGSELLKGSELASRSDPWVCGFDLRDNRNFWLPPNRAARAGSTLPGQLLSMMGGEDWYSISEDEDVGV